MQTEESVLYKKWWLGKPSFIFQMNTLQIQGPARWAQKHQVTQNATKSNNISDHQVAQTNPPRDRNFWHNTHIVLPTISEVKQESCAGTYGGCMRNNCRSLRTSNNRKAPNSFPLPLHPRASKLSGLKVNSSQLVLPHECQLTGRSAYLRKMGGESSCTDTCLTCSSVFL